MKHLITGTALAAMLATGAAQAQETLRMATIAPSLGQAITMATFANIVNDNLEGVTIEVAGGGAATLHQLEIGRGNLEMSMTSPNIYDLMAAGAAMYQNEADAAEAAENVQLLMWFPYGQYHYAVRGDSDIQLLDDIEGATVFIGPQGGGAYHSARRWIEASTGLVVGEDYEAISANWQTGFQAFLDGSVEMYVNGCLDPCQQFLQFSETESLRFIQPEMTEGPEVEAFLGEYSFLEEIPAGIYENQTNDGPVISHNTSVGIAISADLDEELVYQITRAFWENLDQVTSQAPWAAALDVNFAAEQRGLMQLHPGARRYYEEVGAL
ncbi:TAXI family TRAP transporter solute-binding subunit [Alterinioella nitratireducens]|uniref:TAXI family TRAP transporter solute-binding subunit n=1 Tax=Alterinioella nitratireducens TaxID=2735915 RepID=UPI00155681BC|nr:TAXI family TRAP transporter solute-binding subunit [Alterinioella nitratireducens]NPD19907.1 TAXI family TRAP transporter solute-binding subunit [Alterinioella nitratireducens]|tara:strand:+ start:153 stop:1127 length:975 start_codon:yes stop_codon:yes gene_type:complete